MAVEIRGEYIGGLKMDLVHGPSGATQRTAAPVDNRGDGSSFSPTDMLAAALGSCAVTTMAIVAERHGILFPDAAFVLEKHMHSEPRRVGRVPLRIRMPPHLNAEQRETLENAARNCPVARSLNTDVDVEFVFEYQGHDAP
jgi:putative redox protein